MKLQQHLHISALNTVSVFSRSVSGVVGRWVLLIVVTQGPNCWRLRVLAWAITAALESRCSRVSTHK